MNAEPHAVGSREAEPASADFTPTPLYPDSSSPPLRVACVVPRCVPAWLARLTAMAGESRWLTWVVLKMDSPREPSRAPLPWGLRSLLRSERARRRDTAGMFTDVVLDELANPASVLGCRDTADVEAALAALHPDLILVLGELPWSEELAKYASHGCWVLDDSLFDPDAAAARLLCPLVAGEVATAAELELAAPAGTTWPLQKSIGATCLTSVTQQCEQVFRKMPALVLRSLRRLHAGEVAWPKASIARLRVRSGPMLPGAGLRAVARTLLARLQWRWRQARLPHEDPWFVCIRRDDRPLDPELPTITRFEALKPAPDLGPQIWADPCVVEDQARRLVFVEECTPDAPRAHIACLELPEQGPARRLGVALECPWHLSFPQVFLHEGQWFMTVESGQARCTMLYRAKMFPLSWQPLQTLVSGRHCVDPVLYVHDGHWYLFVNIAESGGSTWDELFLFVARSLEGPFVPHPANPIVADVRHARQAGALFVRDGRLIRPAQDCSPSYGAATVFNEVLVLSPTEYRERPLGRLDASWWPGGDGCHTYSATDQLEVLDARGRWPRNGLPLMVG